jgi:pyruvate ferredoxin oxidoreductase gamma subunit
MIKIIIYGRGGQGVVKAAQLLAIAAFLSNYEAQAFPMFGVERRGSPAQAFVRIDKKPIRTRTQITKADYAIVLDSTLLNPKINAKKIIVNSHKKFSCCRNFDADTIATKIFPQAINTAMIAAFAFFAGIINKDVLVKACHEIFDAGAAQKNIQVIGEVYSTLKTLKNE